MLEELDFEFIGMLVLQEAFGGRLESVNSKKKISIGDYRFNGDV